MIADKNIFDRNKHGVSNMERVIGVGGRHNDGKRFGLRVWDRGESTTFFPEMVDLVFVVGV